MLQAEGRLSPVTPMDERQLRKRSRTDSPLADDSDSQPLKRVKSDPSTVLYDTIDDIWQASMLLKPAFLHDQDLNVGLVDEELETLKVASRLIALKSNLIDPVFRRASVKSWRNNLRMSTRRFSRSSRVEIRGRTSRLLSA